MKKSYAFFILGAALTVALLVGAGCRNGSRNGGATPGTATTTRTNTLEGVEMLSTLTISENVAATPLLTTFIAAGQNVGTITTLNSSTGTYTAFIPTNEAFVKVPTSTLRTWVGPSNRAILKRVMEYHVVQGIYRIEDLWDGQELTTLNGQKLTVSREGNTIRINDATITAPNVLAKNGVFHVIDRVIIATSSPKTVTSTKR